MLLIFKWKVKTVLTELQIHDIIIKLENEIDAFMVLYKKASNFNKKAYRIEMTARRNQIKGIKMAIEKKVV